MEDLIGEFYKITVHLVGIKKRARKSDNHYISGGYLPYNNGNYDKELVETIARNAINKNIKTVTSKKVYIHLDYIIKGEFMEQWRPFSENNVKFELESSLESALQ